MNKMRKCWKCYYQKIINKRFTLKIITTFLLTVPVYVSAADHSVTLTVKGTAENACTVTMPSTFDMGKFRSKDWRTNGYMSTSSSEIEITLSDCDKGTQVVMQAKGDHSGTDIWLLSNKNTQYSNIVAEVQVYMEELDKWQAFHLNGTSGAKREVTTLKNNETSKKLKLRTWFARKPDSTETNPAGKYKGEITLIFNFL